MSYTPGPLPSGELTPNQIMEFLFRELLELSKASQFAEDLVLPYLHREPDKVVAGMLVHADGTDWDPDLMGLGEGLYRRNMANNAWVFLG